MDADASGDGRVTRRIALRARLERHSIALDIVMAALAVVYILIGEVNDGVFGYRPNAFTIGIELAITAVFVLEYGARLYAAENRGRFVRTHVLELLSLISTLRLLRGLQFLRILRLLRLARIATFSHAFARLVRAMNAFDRTLSDPLIAYGIVGIAGLVFFGSLAIFGFEKGANPAIHTYADAFWLAVSIVLTIGISGTHPVTDEGRAVAGVLIVGGLTCISFFSSAMAVRFQRKTQDDVVARLERIETLLRDAGAAAPATFLEKASASEFG